ncbi:cell division protein FtsB [Marinospirillum alkaliphilum]|uniref:Cell division protein FtsB n=1 Tax=Marinospirillum alkaliphilum DSM 21637 TaxID=1122209 RepID=A0A1K1VBE1_9GAMM|nr:cell division protein FtsB [Marinospirillum alkaliphilum]SFX21885.1 cell division protein FtsB [Marinospirillum alkaliphilum DSM 21637]
MFRLLTYTLLLLLLITQYRLWWGENGLLEYREIGRLVAHQEQENQQLRKRNERLNAEVQDLKSGLDAVEERARFDLGMIGKQETFFWLIGQPPAEFRLFADQEKSLEETGKP